MTYEILVGCSYGDVVLQPGDIADLTSWPVDDLARMEAEGVILRLEDHADPDPQINDEEGTDQ